MPRLVNQLCDFAMLYAWSSDTKLVDAAIVKQVLDDGVFFGAIEPAKSGDEEGVTP